MSSLALISLRILEPWIKDADLSFVKPINTCIIGDLNLKVPMNRKRVAIAGLVGNA